MSASASASASATAEIECLEEALPASLLATRLEYQMALAEGKEELRPLRLRKTLRETGSGVGALVHNFARNCLSAPAAVAIFPRLHHIADGGDPSRGYILGECPLGRGKNQRPKWAARLRDCERGAAKELEKTSRRPEETRDYLAARGDRRRRRGRAGGTEGEL